MKYYASTLKNIALGGLITSLFLPSIVLAYEASPVAITKNATFITEKSARLNGQVNPNSMPDAKQWFEWGVSGKYQTVYETPHSGVRSGSVLAPTSANLTGLAPSTQYFYRQVAENGRGKDVGMTVYFTTKPLPTQASFPVIVQTNEPSFISTSGATLRGYVAPHGDSRATFWFQWGTTMNFENETPHRGHGGDSGVIEVKISSLAPGTTHFFRVVGENSQGRVYGATRIFITSGTPPPPPEAPIDQSVASPQKDVDTTTRKVTTSGASASSGSANAQASGRPGDIFNLGALFSGKKDDGTQSEDTSQVKEATSTNDGVNQAAAVAASSGPFGTFWSNLSGKKPVELTLENVGPKDVPAHSTVEYRMTYHYRAATPAVNAKLKFTLPGDVVYIGDTTNNELLLEEGVGPERTYILPLGRLETGSTRVVSVLGMTTGSAKGFPIARARLEYVDQSGAVQVVAANGGAVKNTASVGNASGSFLPSSFIGWVLYILLIVLSIVGVRKARTYYAERKKELEQARSSSEAQSAYASGGRMSQGA